jgi:hypothetical protein
MTELVGQDAVPDLVCATQREQLDLLRIVLSATEVCATTAIHPRAHTHTHTHTRTHTCTHTHTWTVALSLSLLQAHTEARCGADGVAVWGQADNREEELHVTDDVSREAARRRQAEPGPEGGARGAPAASSAAVRRQRTAGGLTGADTLTYNEFTRRTYTHHMHTDTHREMYVCTNVNRACD